MSLFTKDPLTIDDVCATDPTVRYPHVAAAIRSGELPAELVDGSYTISRTAAEAWIASRRGRTSAVPGLTPEDVASLSGGKHTPASVRRAIALGELAALPVPAELTSAVRSSIDGGDLPEVTSLESLLSIDPTDAATWLARTLPAGLSVDDVVKRSAGKAVIATVHRAIETGALPAERLGDVLRFEESDVTAWLAGLPTVNLE